MELICKYIYRIGANYVCSVKIFISIEICIFRRILPWPRGMYQNEREEARWVFCHQQSQMPMQMGWYLSNPASRIIAFWARRCSLPTSVKKARICDLKLSCRVSNSSLKFEENQHLFLAMSKNLLQFFIRNRNFQLGPPNQHPWKQLIASNLKSKTFWRFLLASHFEKFWGKELWSVTRRMNYEKDFLK